MLLKRPPLICVYRRSSVLTLSLARIHGSELITDLLITDYFSAVLSSLASSVVAELIQTIEMFGSQQ